MSEHAERSMPKREQQTREPVRPRSDCCWLPLPSLMSWLCSRYLAVTVGGAQGFPRREASTRTLWPSAVALSYSRKSPRRNWDQHQTWPILRPRCTGIPRPVTGGMHRQDSRAASHCRKTYVSDITRSQDAARRSNANKLAPTRIADRTHEWSSTASGRPKNENRATPT